MLTLVDPDELEYIFVVKELIAEERIEEGGYTLVKFWLSSLISTL